MNLRTADHVVWTFLYSVYCCYNCTDIATVSS